MIIGAALSAAGTGVSVYNSDQQAKQQDQAAAQSIINQGKLNSQANSQVQNLTKEIANSTPDQAAAAQKAAYTSALQNALPASSTDPTMSGASKRYNTDAANDAASVRQYGNTQAGIDANVNAPQLQRLGESFDIGNTASNLGLLQNQSAGLSTELSAQEKSIQSNPWLSTLGSAMATGGTIYGSKYNSSTNINPDPYYGAGANWLQNQGNNTGVAPITG
jgi:hypothetical protein